MKKLLVALRRMRVRSLLAKVSPLLADYNAAMIRAGIPRQERKQRLRVLLNGGATLTGVLEEMVR